MCGRFQISKVVDEVQIRFHVDVEKEWYRQIFNAAPAMLLPVITNEESENLNFFRWGLIPSWSKVASIGSKMINARAETLTEKPTFKKALQKRRCLIPSDGFYEWKKTSSGKQPFRICMKDESLFAYAGLWENWKDKDDKLIQTFTIITTTPNRIVADIHDRMPVILKPEFEKLWLDTQIPLKEIVEILKPFPEQEMKAYLVSPLINSVKNNSPELMAEIGNGINENNNLELF